MKDISLLPSPHQLPDRDMIRNAQRPFKPNSKRVSNVTLIPYRKDSPKRLMEWTTFPRRGSSMQNYAELTPAWSTGAERDKEGDMFNLERVMC